jgi:CubicO group peptidase (beta-lactamase class C family)
LQECAAPYVYATKVTEVQEHKCCFRIMTTPKAETYTGFHEEQDSHRDSSQPGAPTDLSSSDSLLDKEEEATMTQFNPIRASGQKHRRVSVFMRAEHTPLWGHFLFALLLFGCLIVSACSGASAPTHQATPTVGVPAFASKLKPLLEAKMLQLHTPGAIVYVNDPHQGSWTTTLGTSNLTTLTPMNVKSYMHIGSITKTFTATIILQLAEEGRLRLNDPVSKYQPEVPNGSNITIRELLSMTSGLFDFIEDKGFIPQLATNPTSVWNPKDVLAIAFKHPPIFAPGKEYSYSNTNYILLGMIIEQITHQSVEDVFQQRIFRPLGMSSTSLPPRKSSIIPDPHPHGYTYLPDLHDATNWTLSYAWTAGAAISTLHDLQIWAKALATGQLLSSSMQRERLTLVATGTPIKYGLGIYEIAGFLGHDGAVPGFTSFMGYQPEMRAMIVVLTNLDPAPGGADPAGALASVILKQLFL